MSNQIKSHTIDRNDYSFDFKRFLTARFFQPLQIHLLGDDIKMSTPKIFHRILLCHFGVSSRRWMLWLNVCLLWMVQAQALFSPKCEKTLTMAIQINF